MSVGAVTSVAPATRPDEATAAASPRPNLLMRPSSGGNPASALLILQQIMLGMRESGVESGKARVERNEKLVEIAIDEVHEARAEQWEAEEDKSFWDDVADVFSEVGKWVGAVASTALAIVSCGAAAPLAGLAVAGAILSCASTIDSTFGISSEIFGKEAGMWINLGLSLGGAVCSGISAGAGIIQAAKAAKTVAEVEKVASSVEAGFRFAAGTAVVGGAVASGTGAIARGVAAGYQRDADMSEAAVVAGENRQKRIERQIQKLMDTIKELVTSREHGLRKVADAMHDNNSANLALMRA